MLCSYRVFNVPEVCVKGNSSSMPKVKKHKTVLAVRQTVTKPQKQTASKHSETKPTKERNAAPKPKQQRAAWTCASIIDQQSADALSKLLAAAETHTAGATIKSLTLAPHIVHKKPTFAVTVETLKHLPLLKAVLGQVGLLQQHEHQVHVQHHAAVHGCLVRWMSSYGLYNPSAMLQMLLS